MCSQYFLDISCEKITFLRQKILFFFPILGGHVPGASPPGSAPGIVLKHIQQHIYTIYRIRGEHGNHYTTYTFILVLYTCTAERYDMVVDKHERLSNFALIHKLI
jgi:hypothetical protein